MLLYNSLSVKFMFNALLCDITDIHFRHLQKLYQTVKPETYSKVGQ